MLIKLQCAIVLCAALNAVLFAHTALAASTVGTVDYVSGTVSIQHADGSTRLVGVDSALENGDTVQTAQDAEAVLILADKQRIYLKPGSVFRIDDFSFVENNPSANKSFLSLLKGGLRTISGLIGKQGNEADYQLKTKTATIGIRGTEYSAIDCAGGNCGDLPDGVHVSVYDGLVVVTNQTGGTEIGTGFGAIVPDVTTPVTQLPARNVQPVVAPPEACL
jgi:hypothetical protein